MAVVSTSNLFLMALFVVAGIANAELVVDVTPAIGYPMEYSSLTITCAAHDPNNAVVPGRIQIVRITDQFGTEKNMTDADSNLNFTTTKEDNGRKLVVTMKIINVTEDYDSGLDFYICRAYPVNGSSKIGKRQFNINVIQEKDKPKVTVSKLKEVDHSVTTTIFCNVSFRGSQKATLKGFWWTKDGKNLTDSLIDATKESTSLVLKDIDMKDGGKYSCTLHVLLEPRVPYKVEDSTSLTVRPWFESKDDKSVKMRLEGDLTLVCGARGYPLKVEWKFKSETDGSVKPCIDSSKDERYNVSQKGPYDPYSLTIESLSEADIGVYYCCLPSGCSEDIDKDRCQSFDIDEIGDPTAGQVSAVAHNVFVILALFVVSLSCL